MRLQDGGPSRRVTPREGLTAHASTTSSTSNGDSGNPPASSAQTLARHTDLDRLVPLVYSELRVLAHHRLAARGGRSSLNTTALVHEVYMKLANSAGRGWRDRAHFFALASKVMRQILTDRARACATRKRGAGHRRITLDEQGIAVAEQADALLELDDALAQLASVSPRLVRVVECRFFGGMADAEIAEVVGVTERTVRRDWDKARLLLQGMLNG